MRDSSYSGNALCDTRPVFPLSQADRDRFAAAYARILAALNIQTQSELTAVLQVRQSAISDAKRRAVIPGWWLVRLLLDYRLSPQWILSGEGPRTYGNDAPLDPDEVDRLMALVRG